MEMKNWIKTIAFMLAWGSSIGAAWAQVKVVGYFPTWQGSVTNIQYDKLTHINYSFLWPSSTGGLTSLSTGNANKLNQLVSLAHESNVKVLIAVGGWNNGNDSDFEVFAANQTYRTNFTVNVLNFIEQYDLDGVDIDWEYPDPGTSANNFALLMKELHDTLNPKGYLLTAAVVGNGTTGGGVKDEVFGYVDFLNIMAYDNSAESNHSTYSFATQCLTYWKNRGLAKEKCILGVPFYARTPNYRSFSSISAMDLDEAPYVDEFDGYLYNGIFTMEDKTYYAGQNAGGIMIWELSQDRNDDLSLLTTIYNTFDAMNLTLSATPSVAEKSITIYPNPARSSSPLFLRGFELSSLVEVKVIDRNGSICYQGNNLFNTNDLSPGLYQIMLYFKDETYENLRLVVQ
jgi:chitinase